MAQLFIYNNKVESVFQLIGKNENDISYSVGFVFANCKVFLEKFLQEIGITTPFQPEKIGIRLQAYEGNKGFTDFEIFQENEFHIIIEAKRGWTFPSKSQLQKYATRQSFQKSNAKTKKIIIFNESTPAFTRAHFAFEKISSIPVQIVSWRRIHSLAKESIKTGKDSENKLLKELNLYFDKIITMQKVDSNMAYVLSLASGKPEGWSISWKDIVNHELKYFHPVGGGIGGWPKEPPNYIAFRYDGKLQTIHHVDKYDVTDEPWKFFKQASKVKWPMLHYIYTLGQPIRPNHEVKAGKKIVRSMRVWAMIDLLLTCKTIEEARDKTKKRKDNVF